MGSRLTREHKAKISAGLKRYYRAERRKAAQRSAAAKKAATTRKLKAQQREVERGQRKVQRAERLAKKEAKRAIEEYERAAEVGELEEWEVTIKYQKAGSLVSVSVVVFAPNPMPNSGKPPTRDEILGAVWRVANGHGLSVMSVRGVDWRKETRTGKVSAGAGSEIDLQSFKHMMFKSVLRAERVGD